MLRLFVAIPLPGEVRERLAAERHDLTGARWVRAAQFHLTLRFIGEATDDRVPVLDAALGAVAFEPIPLQISGLGTFPDAGPARVLFARVLPHTALARLHPDVEHAIRNAGFEADRRPLHPHITLARFRRCVRQEVEQVLEASTLTTGFDARNFVLYNSHLAREGARHEALRRYDAP